MRPPLLLLAGAAAACQPQPRIGIESVLEDSGLPRVLLGRAKTELGFSVEPIVAEAFDLAELLERGAIDIAITNGDGPTEGLLRKGLVTASPLFHHEAVLVGPAGDPVEIHAQRSFAASMRMIYEGDAAFFQCTRCGVRAREEAVFQREPTLRRKGSSFLDVGPSEKDVIKALRGAPGYALLSRSTVMALLKEKEWSMKPLWSGDALQVDLYRLLSRPPERVDEPLRGNTQQLAAWLLGDSSRALIAAFGIAELGQPIFRPGPPPEGGGFKLWPAEARTSTNAR
ncbi:MAG: hypothetical protein HYV07_20830 [Deltaproteobacteria bacterium]|nr:hypothetical protein [Deltaproteobacteria bacterium]